MIDQLDPLICDLTPITLTELERAAALLERYERKYIVGLPLLTDLLTEHARDHVVLDIDGVRRFRYRTTYFDTPDLACHFAGAHRHRNRTKVRTRQYLDAGTAVVEVKVKDGRGLTIKHRLPHDPDRPDELGRAGISFVRSTSHMPLDPLALSPFLVTSYRRTTLLAPDHSARCTIDLGVRCDAVDGRSVGLDAVVIETKSARSAGSIDRWLWRRGVRPVRISKYSTALALMHPELPRNKWHRTITHTDGWSCAPTVDGAQESVPAA